MGTLLPHPQRDHDHERDEKRRKKPGENPAEPVNPDLKHIGVNANLNGNANGYGFTAAMHSCGLR